MNMTNQPFETMLEKYAELIVQVGLNLRSGQRLLMVDVSRNHGIPISIAPLVRQVAIKAYQAGAPYVDVIWADDQMKLIRFQHARPESFDIFPQWLADALLTAVKRGDALLNISGLNPDLLKGQDSDLIGKWQKVVLNHIKPAHEYVQRNAINWCLVSASVPGWAAKVFPQLPEEEAVTQLWETIFKIVRLDLPDPIAAWRSHLSGLAKRCDYLNEKRYDAFHYLAPGTDLTIGLPRLHRWKGGQVASEQGIAFVPNLPTEEVFTLADQKRADGHVRATKSLAYSGQVIEDFEIQFSEGKVVGYAARKGETVLKQLFETDEGASRLGEAALVPHSSPISKSQIMFHNTLLDENAASHLAFGAAYPFTLEGGEGMSVEEFSKAGGNHSMTHVDFMIGCAEMDVDGILENGIVEPVMRQGEWAFEV